ncbi:pre-mRNA 3'-end-processing factor FIP1 isoform X2 [Perca flavescens]|uniref:pre-mRNA 3'-end-processing factor FIP1 isoform X2 n=1 Tax=Perca flavescens TaxID=8167 RepID=UPI00106DFE52|nr:pre-mRNA 3'-end-processing factor FIP1 isoform X2 [Perca flavescens]
MFSSESDSKDVTEDSDEGQIYQLIYDMITRDDKEEVQIPSSSENTPLHLKTDAEWSAHAFAMCSDTPFSDGSEDETTHNPTHTRQKDQEVKEKKRKKKKEGNDQEVGNTKGLDTDALDSIPGIPVPKASEEKPWRKAGANISDYFNFGFDEESWNTYSTRQSKVRKANRKLYTKILAQKEKESSSPAPPSSGSPSILPSRQPSATNNANKGRRGSRVERSRRLSDGENHSQVTTEMSPEEDRFTSYPSSPSNFNSLFAYIPPPPFLFRSGPLSASPFAALDGAYSKGFDDPSTSGHPCSSAVSPLIPRSMSSKTGGIDTAEAWECYKRKEKHDKDRDRSREHGRDKDTTRSRNRDRESCSSSHSAEERTRHRDTTERGHRRHSLREKEERHGERRHTDDSEGWKKSSRSSSRRPSGEDRDSQSRHKHKKAKRNRKDKETKKMSSDDQGRKLKRD